MESADVVAAPGTSTTFLGKLAGVAVRPRRTMRRILEAGADRMVVPLLLLAYISAIFRDLSIEGLRLALSSASSGPLAVVLTVLLICIPGAMVLLFYGVSWVVAQIGRLLDGQGRAREMRSALAWGLAPFIWALLYRIPASFFQAAPANGRSPELFQLFRRGGLSAGFAFVEVLVLVWYLVVTSATIGEAHGFSNWKGFATLLMVLTIPFILALAALLTSVT